MCNLTFGFIYPEEPSDEGSLETLRSAQSHCERSPAPCLPCLPAGRRRQAMTTLLDILR